MVRAFICITAFIVLSMALVVALVVIAALRLPGRGAVARCYSRALCALLGIRIRVTGAPLQGRPVLVVSNHVSWLDILVITATTPAIFVAKQEVAGWPLIGLIARMRGTVFVDRERRGQAAGTNAEIAARLAEGAMIVLFGEGTSSDGNRVLPFRTALFGAVNEALAQLDLGPVFVQPLSIGYVKLQGLPMGRQHRYVAAWYGDATLIAHLLTYMARGPVDVTLAWGEPIATGAGTDRKALAKSLEDGVRRRTAEILRGRPLAPEWVA
jgi:1-acyl-sn-glycerol-3-phosphate acyltransferase